MRERLLEARAAARAAKKEGKKAKSAAAAASNGGAAAPALAAGGGGKRAAEAPPAPANGAAPGAAARSGGAAAKKFKATELMPSHADKKVGAARLAWPGSHGFPAGLGAGRGAAWRAAGTSGRCGWRPDACATPCRLNPRQRVRWIGVAALPRLFGRRGAAMPLVATPAHAAAYPPRRCGRACSPPAGRVRTRRPSCAAAQRPAACTCPDSEWHGDWSASAGRRRQRLRTFSLSRGNQPAGSCCSCLFCGSAIV